MTSYTLITKTLPADQVRAWNDKLRVYHMFEPHYMRVGDDVSVWDSFGAEPRSMTVDEYNADKIVSDPTFHVVVKTADLSCAYTWDKKPVETKDAVDELLERDRSSFKRVALYGLHTYGGYHGFFRPDLEEVINLIAGSGHPALAFDRVSRVYVNTEPHPDGHVGLCYDAQVDRHRAETVCYVVPAGMLIPMRNSTPSA